MQTSLPRSLSMVFSATILLGAILVSPVSGWCQEPAEQTETPELDLGEESTEDPGQTDLDEAAVLRFDAKTPRELQAVERLLQSSIKKGLTGENEEFAKKMLGSVLLQKSQQIAGAMTPVQGRQPLSPRDEALRGEALRTLEQAVTNDPELVEGYLLIARLNMLRGGDKQAIIEATSNAIEILDDDPVERSAALVLRALTYGVGDDEKRMADLNAAVKDDPKNVEALWARAVMRLQNDDVTGAIDDMQLVLAENPTNQQVAQTVVQQLVRLDRVDDALELLTKAIDKKPSEGLYKLRSVLHRMERNEAKARADLDKAIELQPRDPIALLQRAEMALSRDDIQAAKDDLRAAERVDRRVRLLDQAIFVRCLIAIEENRMADAINEMKTLVERDPDNQERRLNLANLYIQDERPRKAIEMLSSVIDADPKNVGALRSRADALLAVGDHVEAINDYETAIEAAGDDEQSYDVSGLLNNLAWVLATSPNDAIRNGKRSVELGERAVELTNESEPHILSTLAAAYAEVGDFDKAIEWSGKAVELGKEQDHDQLEQLEEELENYRARKPWREKQETEENKKPILNPEDLIDT